MLVLYSSGKQCYNETVRPGVSGGGKGPRACCRDRRDGWQKWHQKDVCRRDGGDQADAAHRGYLYRPEK